MFYKCRYNVVFYHSGSIRTHTTRRRAVKSEDYIPFVDCCCWTCMNKHCHSPRLNDTRCGEIRCNNMNSCGKFKKPPLPEDLINEFVRKYPILKPIITTSTSVYDLLSIPYISSYSNAMCL